MKTLIRHLSALILTLSLVSGSAGALAAGSADGFKDHWAAETLNRAVGDSLISGEAADILPNAAITGAQLVGILCRVLAAEEEADLSSVTDISKSDPYYKAAAQAVAIGLVSPQDGRLNLTSPVTRGRAFMILADAFQLVGAIQDTTLLTRYSDSDALFGRYRTAAAALTAAEFVRGSGNLLHSDENISLAEFLTILYRIIPNYRQTGQLGVPAEGGSIFSYGASANMREFQGTIYFDGASTNISLQSVEAPCAVVRSGSLGGLSVNSCNIGRLVIAAGGGDISLSPDSNSAIDTVVVGDGGGTVTLGGIIPNVEVNGSGRSVYINGKVQTLLISASGCTVILGADCTVGTVKILGPGTGNILTVNGSCGECEIYGADASLGGSGSIQNVADNTGGSAITVKALKTTVNGKYGLAGAAIAMKAPEELPFYLSLNATVDITAPDSGNSCKGLWYLDDVLISSSDVTLGTTPSASLSYAVKNESPIPVTARLSFVLSFEDPVSGYQELRAGKDIVLENAVKFDVKDVLSLVTTGYKGDYTLKWAQTHDYDGSVKAAWVNYQGYSSKTQYLIWVSITYQRVNVFTGSAGNWKLDRSFLVGTGAPGKETPLGVFKVIGRSTAGWTTKEYTVKPVIFFNTYAYGFHSRLYYPKTTKIFDPKIGFPVSHGCVRMYDEDVAWFYKNIPSGTTVVVY